MKEDSLHVRDGGEYLPDAAIVYYLDAAPAASWSEDFARIRDLGISRLIVCDMLSLVETLRDEPARVTAAMDAARQRGLRVQIMAFHPGLMLSDALPLNYLAPEYHRFILTYRYHMPRYPEDKALSNPDDWLLVDNAMRIYPVYDIHNPRWQEDWLLPYLRLVVEQYAEHPAFDGLAITEPTFTPDVASYNDADAARFREFLTAKYGDIGSLNAAWCSTHESFEQIMPPRAILAWDPAWMDWREARSQWLVALGHSIREAVGDTRLCLCETDYNLYNAPTMIGGYSPAFVASFDSFAVEPLEIFDQDVDATARGVATQLELAKALANGRPFGLRLRACVRAGKAPPTPEQMRVALEAGAEAGAQFVEFAQYATPYFPGELFLDQPGLWRHPELARAIRGFVQAYERS